MPGQYSRRRHPRRRKLQLESLEPRSMLNAAPLGLPDSYSVLQGQLLQVQAPVTAATTSAELPNLFQVNSFQTDRAFVKIVYSPQYQRLAALGEDDTVTIYDSRNGNIISHLDVNDELESVAITPDGKYFYARQDLAYLHRFNFETSAWEVKTFPTPYIDGTIFPINDNRFLMYQFSDSVRLWDYGPTGSTEVVSVNTSARTYGDWDFDVNTGLFYGLREVEYPGLELFQLVDNKFVYLGRHNNIPVTRALKLSVERTELYSGFYQYILPNFTAGNTFGEPILASAGKLAFSQNSYWNAITGVKLGTFSQQFEAIDASSDAQWFWGFDKQTLSLTQYRIPGTMPGLLSNDTDADQDSLTASLLAAPAHGSVTLHADGYFEYQADPLYQGVDQFTYRAFDGVAYSDPVTVQINVWPYFDGVATVQTYQATEDQTLVVSAASGLVRGAVDSSGQPVQAALDSAPRHGTVTIAANGSFQYTPSANYFGPDTFTYRLSGDGQTWQSGMINLNISNTPDLPVIVADNYRTLEDQTLRFELPISSTTTAENFAGLRLQQTIAYTGTIEQIEFSARSNSLAILEQDKLSLIDAATGATLTTATTALYFSDIAFTADGRYLFIAERPSSVLYGTEPSYIRRYDLQTRTWVTKQALGIAHELEAIDGSTILVVTAYNTYLRLFDFGITPSQPITEKSGIRLDSSSYTLKYNAELQQVYLGSTWTEPRLLIYEINNFELQRIGAPTYIATTNGYNSTLTFDKNFIYYGTFSADLRDSNYSLQAYPANIGAVANNIAFAGSAFYNTLTRQRLGDLGFTPALYAVDEIARSVWLYKSSTQQLFQYHLPGSYAHPAANDFDPDGGALNFTVLTGTSLAPLLVNADGSLSYTPPANFSGTDSFVYQITDSDGNSVTATATIDIRPVNDAPVAVSNQYSLTEDQPLIVSAANGLLANDTDLDGNTLLILSYTQPARGTVTVAADGSFVFTPNANATGKDLFNYTITDGLITSTAEVTFTIAGTPDNPLALADSYSVNEDTTLSASSSRNVLSNDTNVDNTGNFTAVLVTPPSSGTFTLNAAGTFSYVPALNFNGVVTFAYRAFDGTRYSNVSTATITVQSINDTPVVVTDKYTLPWGSNSLTINAAQGVLANDSDADGNLFTVSFVSTPTRGTVTLNPDGSFTYTRGANYVASDTFTYRASDATSTSGNTTVQIILDTGRIVVGDHTLLPNTPNQQIPIYIDGGAPLTAINLRMQIGDGVNGTSEPVISAISYADTIWSGQITDILGGPAPGPQPVVQSSIAFRESGVSVLSQGKVATLTVDTTGIYGGNFALLLKGTQIGQDSDIVTLGSGGSASPMFLTNGTITVTAATVTSRKTFYNNSYFDDFDSSITPADLATAIATDKAALLPGQAATFANYTSYSKGINGVVIEVENILYQPQLDEFEFRTGNTTTPSAWPLMTVPPTMTVENLATGKVRIYFTWPDHTITKQWLQVLVKAKGPMGLPLDDVFYFGNAIGEVGNQPGNTFVDGSDFIYTRDNKHNFMNRAAITDTADFNRDSLVDATDLGLARDNSTNFLSALKLFTPPAHVTPARTPYVPPPGLTAGLTATPPSASNEDIASQFAAQYGTALATLPTESAATEAAALLAPTPAPKASDNSPDLAAVFAHLAASSSASDDASDDLFLTLRKKKLEV